MPPSVLALPRVAGRMLRIPGAHAPAWVLAETAASALFSLASLLVIGRVIGPHEAGIGAVAVAAWLLADVAGAALFPDALVQRPELGPRHIRSAITAAVLVGFGCAALLLGIAPLLAAGADEPTILWLLLAMAPLLPLSAFSGTASGLALRGRRYRLLALRVLVGQPLALAAGLFAAAGGLGAWAMAINQAVATIFVAGLFLLFGRLPLRPLLDRAALGALWPVALPQFGAVVLTVGKYRLFILALGLLLAQAALAQAHFAFRMLDAALFVVWSAMSRFALPRLCALQGDRAAIRDAYAEMVQLPPLMGLPLALGVALVADDLVAALLGPAWAGTAEAARIAALAACVTFLHGDQFSLFIALGKARRNMIAAMLGLAVPLAALLVLRPATPAGAAMAWSMQALLVTPLLIGWVMRDLHVSLGWLLRHAMPGVVAGAAMVMAVLLLQQSMVDAPALLRLMASVALGATVFIGTAWLALGRRLPAALVRHPAP